MCVFINAGVVPELKPEDDVNIPDSDPHWGVDVTFTKSTSLSYGPWVDRQRYCTRTISTSLSP